MEELQSILDQQINEIKKNGEIFSKEINQDFVNLLIKTFKLSSALAPSITEFLSIKKPTNVIWLSLSECTGCTESFLRNEIPGIDTVLLDLISLNYHDALMTSFGFFARENLSETLKSDYFVIVEGSICIQEDFYITFGAENISGKEELKHVAQGASMVFGVGSCAGFGGIQVAAPNPTKAEKISALLEREIINIPGCPPSDFNIIMNLVYAILFQKAPELDHLGRPLWAYGKTVHDSCERKAKFESGDFVQSFDDGTNQEGYCLYKVGCKGPYAYNNCPKVKFNSKTSWPIQAGHGCIACSEPNFWDDFGVYEEPMKKQFAYFAKPLKRVDKAKHIISDKEEFYDQIKKDQQGIGVFFDAQQTEIVYQGKNILQTNLECNPKIFLDALAQKSKLTGRLVENYKKYFPELYHRNMNFNDESKSSSNLIDVLQLTHFLVCLDEEKDRVGRAFKEAMEFPFSKISDMDFSVKIQEDKIVIDPTKGMRLPLCYFLGGLDYDGIAYSVVGTLCKSIKEGIKKFSATQEIDQVYLGGHLAQNALIQKMMEKI